jgi:hypothetical protein
VAVEDQLLTQQQRRLVVVQAVVVRITQVMETTVERLVLLEKETLVEHK